MQNKFYLIAIGLVLAVTFSTPLFAQSNFNTLQEGEYELVSEETVIPTNLTLHGSYEASFLTEKTGFTGGRIGRGTTNQEMIFHFRSTFNEHVSINAHVSNLKTDLSTQRYGYGSERADEWGDSRDSDGMNLYFKESYLEYNHNPNAVLKIGRHKASLGDEQGLIYEGYGNGITQKCRVGTWCYYAGAMQLGDKENDTLYWGELTYPVYQTGVIINDPWEGKRQKESLDIEFIRAIYNGSKIPMNNKGTWAAAGSGNQATTDAGDAVFFDNQTVEYIAMNIKWNWDKLQSKFYFASLGGHRDFYSQDATTSEYTYLTNRGQGGGMGQVSFDYTYEPEWKVRYQKFLSSGTEQASSDEKYWERDSTGYQEIQKGYFGDALFYLNGIQKSGDGHSAQNLIYNRIGLSYVDVLGDYAFDMDIYEFKHNKAVFVDNGSKKSSIGQEVDIVFRWSLEEHLILKAYSAFFRGKGAYSESDSVVATTAVQEDYSRWGLHLMYKF
ncbi:MAG: hypothetical protein QNL04_08300 [SAR324 cluster bacterium]|nr:hypothetical protein [SAR324 cluster bacterium]